MYDSQKIRVSNIRQHFIHFSKKEQTDLPRPMSMIQYLYKILIFSKILIIIAGFMNTSTGFIGGFTILWYSAP